MRWELVLAGLAALFGYLSWKRSEMGDILNREEVIRNRLKDSAGATNYYNYQLGRLQISEYEGWRYEVLKYIPIVGGIRGNTIVYLWFSPPVGGGDLEVPDEDTISNHPMFQDLPIEDITWKEEVENIKGEGVNLELILDTTDPDEILVAVTDLSGLMLDILSET